MLFDTLELDVISIDILKQHIAMAPPGGKTKVAAELGRTVFPGSIYNVSDGLGKSENVLKRGNSKLSREVSEGLWHGPIYALTLEERATCNRSCNHWADCYGNNMHNARRYVVNASLIERLESELDQIQTKTDKANAKRFRDGKQPIVFVVRLHVLGDFASVDYVGHWRRWLEMFPSLRVWGYTHWHPGTEIGDAILTLRSDFGGTDAREGARFCIRFSDHVDDGPSAVSEDNPMAQTLLAQKKAFICPEQTQSKDRENSDKAIHCGNCKLCFFAEKTVIFKTH